MGICCSFLIYQSGRNSSVIVINVNCVATFCERHIHQKFTIQPSNILYLAPRPFAQQQKNMGRSLNSKYVNFPIEGPLWWNDAATVEMAQPEPSRFHTNRQRSTNAIAMQLQNGLSYDANEFLFDTIAMGTSELMI